MEIRSKYDVGNAVWFADQNKFFIGNIKTIQSWDALSGFRYLVTVKETEPEKIVVVCEKDMYDKKQDILDAIFMSEGDIVTTANEVPTDEMVSDVTTEAPTTTTKAPRTSKK